MTKNVGNIDRAVRAMLGVIILGFVFFSASPIFDSLFINIGAVLVGLIMLVTAGMRLCPLYSIFGLKTCRT